MRRSGGLAWGRHQLPQRLSVAAETEAILKEGIRSGEWHKWLPSEHELCAQLGVARPTLRRALAQLERAGLVRAGQGRRRQVLARRRRVTPETSRRVLLLTSLPLYVFPQFYIFCVDRLRETLAKAGYYLEAHTAPGAYFQRGSGIGLERLMGQLRPAGCIMVGSTEKMQLWFSQRRLPCMVWGSKYPDVELPSLDKAYRAMCRHAVGLFLARGHRRLALLNPQEGWAGDFEGEQGFHEGIARSQRADVEGAVVRHDGTIEGICNELNSLFRRCDRPTGLLVARAVNVLTVMSHLTRCSFRLPEHVSLISRDHEEFLDRMVPSVARYVTTPESMVRPLSATVLEMVRGGLVRSTDSQIMPRFVNGATLGRAPELSQTRRKV
jgi:DNA-binding LacI/PurR family transcriptional regulator